ncbi:MAG: hypothetical protein OJF59_001250 [Cytophagales bacterium]|jgi:hypothetical protein|nr:hypothetical protein [Bacteroidota bacterium]MBS1981874.1 hypothetical protein [Bacteroidota bacterium]WHZ07497.1 MAG: hypothetical protein OJF59_001250 [Cytophagales bacterium]
MQTIYVVGNPGFLELHRKHLDDNSKFLRGHVSVQVPGKEVQLFWIHSKKGLKEFKRAIGADLIWKYRLRFYFDMEEFTPKEEKSELNADEKILMRKAILLMA